jgi:hypothetical protein
MVPLPVNVLRKHSYGVKKSAKEGTQLSNEAETTVGTTLTLGTLWPDIRATTMRQQNTAKDYFQ